MPLKKLYASDFYVIEIDEVKNLVKATWLRAVDFVEMKTGGIKLYEALKESKAEVVVANAQLLGSLDAKTKEWMSTDFYELLSQTSLKRLARVLPENLFAKITLESVATRAEAAGIPKFEFRNFREQNAAEEWLNN